MVSLEAVGVDYARSVLTTQELQGSKVKQTRRSAQFESHALISRSPFCQHHRRHFWNSHNWFSALQTKHRSRFVPLVRSFGALHPEPHRDFDARYKAHLNPLHSANISKMLTGIRRAAAQRLLIRTAFLAGPRTQPLFRVTCRNFSTSRWACLPAAKASSTTTETKKALKAKAGAATKEKAPSKTKAKAATNAPKEKKKADKKKELTPEQMQKLKIEAQKVKVKEQKKLALLPNPKKLPNSAWTVYITERANDPELAIDLESRAKLNSESYKNLSSYELQRLEEKAKENRLANIATYKAWVESHTPIAVAEANRARANIRRITGRRAPRPIHDERQPKRLSTAFIMFVKARWDTGDFFGVDPVVANRQISEQWNALPESEREPYKQLAKADYERWERDSFHTLGRVIVKS
ncbi:Putative High mobility group box domain-containing protein [Colletotrichum destructivum]|uniref:High mobility group box domain-containing protein n=1 Tax=Colletotrichum destructivum TaxID=34406 RepID=A0AAX4I3X4_9PEZI|nr:Putative High mobility group box domain-containing protein [Colletotrichum destructivum]